MRDNDLLTLARRYWPAACEIVYVYQSDDAACFPWTTPPHELQRLGFAAACFDSQSGELLVQQADPPGWLGRLRGWLRRAL